MPFLPPNQQRKSTEGSCMWIDQIWLLEGWPKIRRQEMRLKLEMMKIICLLTPTYQLQCCFQLGHWGVSGSKLIRLLILKSDIFCMFFLFWWFSITDIINNVCQLLSSVFHPFGVSKMRTSWCLAEGYGNRKDLVLAGGASVSPRFCTRLPGVRSPAHLWRWRSSATALFKYVSTRTLRATIGDRAFPAAAASVWNSLSESVWASPSLPVFRGRLKTELSLAHTAVLTSTIN